MLSRNLLATSLFASTCLAQFKTFVTRPHDNALNITVLVNNNPNALAPGLWFLSPYILGGQYFGPQIYTSDGVCTKVRSMFHFTELICPLIQDSDLEWQ